MSSADAADSAGCLCKRKVVRCPDLTNGRNMVPMGMLVQDAREEMLDKWSTKVDGPAGEGKVRAFKSDEPKIEPVRPKTSAGPLPQPFSPVCAPTCTERLVQCEVAPHAFAYQPTLQC